MDKRVFPVLLSLLCGTVLSSTVTDLNREYEDRLSEAEERVFELISDLLDDPVIQEDISRDGSEVGFPGLNIPVLDIATVQDDDLIGSEEARLFLQSLTNNGRAYDTKRAGSFDCLNESCEEVERRRQPNRNAHYRTLPFGKRVQRQKISTRNPRKYKTKTKNSNLLPFGKRSLTMER